MADRTATPDGVSHIRGRVLFLSTAGALAALGHQPQGWWPLTILGFAALLALAPLARTPLRMALSTFAFGLGYFAITLRWIVEPFLVDADRHGWMAFPAMVLMCAGMAAIWLPFVWGLARIAGRSAGVVALGVLAGEAFRALALTGFPWGAPGQVWVGTGLEQASALGGPHLLNALMMMAGGAVALLVARRWLLGGALAAPLIVAGLLGWALPGPTPDGAPNDRAPTVRLVQPNVAQSEKWDPDLREGILTRLLASTAAGEAPDLVIWPETAVPSLLNYIEVDLQPYAEAARGAPLVFGIQRMDFEGRFYNSLVALGPGGVVEGLYDKRHLVPFGEYAPGGALARRLGMTGLADAMGLGFALGQLDGLVDLEGIGTARVLICYEGIFAEEIGEEGPRPRLMILITNDAWFGTGPGPRQHLAQARLRAIEQGVPMVRVANTGISAVIDAWGRPVATIPLGEQGALDAPLPPMRGVTPYACWGDWPVLGLFVLAALALTWRRRCRLSD